MEKQEYLKKKLKDLVFDIAYFSQRLNESKIELEILDKELIGLIAE